MPSQKMRLEAEMRDNASQAIRKLRQELADLQAQTAEVRGIAKLNKEIATLRKESGDVRATPGMKAFTGWMDEARGRATGFIGSIKDIPGILGAVGIGGIAAGASVAALASEMKKLGDRALDLKEMSRQTGMSSQFVNSWAHAGQHFKVAEDAMNGMLNSFSAQLPDFQAGTGQMFNQFSLWPNALRKIQEDIKHHNPAQALIDALKQAEEVGRTKGPQVQKEVLESILPGLGGEAEKLFGDGGLAGLQKQINKPWAAPSQELTKQALALRDATIDFNNSLQIFENKIGPKFLSMLSAIVDKSAQFFDPDPKRFEQQRKGGAEDERKNNKDVLDFFNDPRYKDALKNGKGPPPLTAHGFFSGDGWWDQNNDKSAPPLKHKESYDGSGFGGLLHNASFTTGGTGTGTMEGAISEGSRAGVLQALREWAAQSDVSKGVGFTNASFGDGGSGGFGAGAGGRGTGGGRGFGKPGGGGAADDSPLPQGLLENIMRAEGTNNKDPYNTVLGNGKYGLPSKPLTSMTLAEAYKFGLSVRHNPKNPFNSSALGAFQIVGGTMMDAAKGLGLDPNSVHFDAETQRKMAGWIAHHQGLGAWAGFGTHPRELEAARRALAGGGGGSANAASAGSSAPGHIGGQLSIGGDSYRFGSGGVRGSSSIPYGDHEITPNSVGAWGRSVGALGVSGGHIWDKALGRMREGIELHMGHSANLVTEGCVAFEKSQWPKVKAQVLEMIRKTGHAYLHVGKDGASISPTRRAEGLADNPHAGRRASGDLHARQHQGQSDGNQHKLTVGFEFTGDGVRHKSTKVERGSRLQIDVTSPWKTGRNHLINT